MSIENWNVSVVIPVRNGANYLAEAIRSCIAQTLAAQEIIVVDDGSTDATADVAKRFGDRVTLLRQPWAGVGAAMNRGIVHSRGEFLAFLDHDDIWLPDKTSHQLREFQERPELEAVFGRVEQFITPELETLLKDKVRVPQGANDATQTSVMLLRRAAWQRIGPFDEDRDPWSFQSWFPRALRNSLRMTIMPVLVARRRIHQSNSSRLQRGELYQSYLNLAREMALHHRRHRPAQRADEKRR